MKLMDWAALGQVGILLEAQLAELGAAEEATHVTVNPDSGRIRILIATDLGLFEFSYAAAVPGAGSPSMLRGQLYRWTLLRGVRVQTDAQLESDLAQTRWIWHLVVEEPHIELVGDSQGEADRALGAVLPFVRACLLYVGQ